MSRNRSSLPPQRLSFTKLEKAYVSDGLKRFKNRWSKCVELNENYIKNESPLFQNLHFSFVG